MPGERLVSTRQCAASMLPNRSLKKLSFFSGDSPAKALSGGNSTTRNTEPPIIGSRRWGARAASDDPVLSAGAALVVHTYRSWGTGPSGKTPSNNTVDRPFAVCPVTTRRMKAGMSGGSLRKSVRARVSSSSRKTISCLSELHDDQWSVDVSRAGIRVAQTLMPSGHGGLRSGRRTALRCLDDTAGFHKVSLPSISVRSGVSGIQVSADPEGKLCLFPPPLLDFDHVSGRRQPLQVISIFNFFFENILGVGEN
jgi:hypothetical protein